MARITSALIALLLLLALLAGSTPVAAQTNPPGDAGGGGGAAPATTAGALNIVPGNLTVELVTGQVAPYQLLIEASSEITGVQAIPLDLYRSDNKGILSASKITVGLPATPVTLTAGVPLTVPLQIDLRNVSAGEYGGSLLMNYGGGRVSLPMVVRVKDDWYLPLVLLLLGVAVGTAVANYRDQGRPRDEVLVRIGDVRRQINEDPTLREPPATTPPTPDLAQPYRARIETQLYQAGALVQLKKWDDANTTLTQADTLLSRWVGNPKGWREQLGYLVDLIVQIQGAINTYASPYLTQVSLAARSLYDNVADQPGVAELRTAAAALGQQFNNYKQIDTLLKALRQLGGTGPAQAAAFQGELDRLTPSDAAAYADLSKRVQDAIAALQTAAGQPEGTRDLLAGFRRTQEPPPTRAAQQIQASERAGRALRIFATVSVILTILFLAMTGFLELYGGKPTFGANAGADYFGLILWGFATEPTRNAIVGMGKGLGVASLTGGNAPDAPQA